VFAWGLGEKKGFCWKKGDSITPSMDRTRTNEA